MLYLQLLGLCQIARLHVSIVRILQPNLKLGPELLRMRLPVCEQPANLITRLRSRFQRCDQLQEALPDTVA